MVLKPDDLVCYAALNMPEDETSPNGGAIGGLRVDWGDVADSIYSVSGVPGGAVVTVTVRHRSGHRESITHVGGGTFDFGIDDPVTGLLKVVSNLPFADGGVIGSITVGVPVCGMKAGDLGITKTFIGAYASDGFGGGKMYYNKIFWCNTSATDTVFNALVQKQRHQTIIPKDLISFALVAAKNDLSGTANRLTGPAATIFGDADKLVPGLNLGPADRIGVWLSMRLKPNLHPSGFTYKSQCTGQTASTP